MPDLDPTPAADLPPIPATDLDLDPPEAELETQHIGEKVHPLYRHSKREKWGLSMVIRRLDDRVDLQFQDGRRRTFLSPYFHLIEAVDRPYDTTVGIVEALRSMFDEEGASSQVRDELGARPIGVDEQVAFFVELFEGGFQGEAYATQHRSDEDRARQLKRHRDSSVAKARELLSPAAFEGTPAEVHQAAVKVLATTDLVPAKERALLKAMAEEHHEGFATTLQAFLYGDGPLVQRVDGFVTALTLGLGVSPSWELATAFVGLVQPDKHVVVRAKTFQRQAVFMAPGLRCSERPLGLLYTRLLTMVEGTRDRLVKEGLKPRDLLDVRDFMWMTLKPAGRRRILEMRGERRLGGDDGGGASPTEAAAA